MATLASAIAARLRLLIAPATLQDLTTQRNASASAEDTSVTDEAAAQAAAEVEGYLGDNLTDADKQAVAYGTKLALIDLAGTYTLAMPDNVEKSREQIEARLTTLASSRVLAQGTPVTARPDLSALDAAFPGSDKWDDEFNDEYTPT